MQLSSTFAAIASLVTIVSAAAVLEAKTSAVSTALTLDVPCSLIY